DQLSEKQNQQDQHADRNEHFNKREAAARPLGACRALLFHHRLTAMNVSTLPAGVPVVGTTCAGQLTKTFATVVDALGGNKYVIFALNVASGGAAGSPWATVPVIVAVFVKKRVSGWATNNQCPCSPNPESPSFDA